MTQRGGRRGRQVQARRYPRSARVNRILLEVLAETLERLAVADERLHMVTVTAVDCEQEMKTAVVYLASLEPEAAAALADARVRLQAAISREARLRRTPLLQFAADPAIAAGQRIEDILRAIGPIGDGEEPDASPSAGAADPDER